MVQAFHTNTAPGGGDDPFSAETGVAIGQCAGWVIGLGETTIYHTGDTCLFGDMRLIAERTPVDVALVPIGGHYTMDRHDAVAAVDLIRPQVVIPMHYNTFPAIETDAGAFQSDVEAQTSAHCVVLEPGQTHTV
jgi:L-ascorbate metabolism protein UlaG (beta-lactamase superfamily)